MIDVRLSIDTSTEPISGQIVAGEARRPTPFTGYVELISALERACQDAQRGQLSSATEGAAG